LGCGESEEEEDTDGVELELGTTVLEDRFGKDLPREESKIEEMREEVDVEEERRDESDEERGFVMGMPSREDTIERTLIIVDFT